MFSGPPETNWRRFWRLGKYGCEVRSNSNSVGVAGIFQDGDFSYYCANKYSAKTYINRCCGDFKNKSSLKSRCFDENISCFPIPTFNLLKISRSFYKENISSSQALSTWI